MSDGRGLLGGKDPVEAVREQRDEGQEVRMPITLAMEGELVSMTFGPCTPEDLSGVLVTLSTQGSNAFLEQMTLGIEAARKQREQLGDLSGD